MSKLSDRIRLLNSGYQGMDDQAAIIREVELLEEENAALRESVNFVSYDHYCAFDGTVMPGLSDECEDCQRYRE